MRFALRARADRGGISRRTRGTIWTFRSQGTHRVGEFAVDGTRRDAKLPESARKRSAYEWNPGGARLSRRDLQGAKNGSAGLQAIQLGPWYFALWAMPNRAVRYDLLRDGQLARRTGCAGCAE